jgi:hypothetical protein
MSIRARVFLLAAVFLFAAPAQAGFLPDLATLLGKDDDDPYTPLHEHVMAMSAAKEEVGDLVGALESLRIAATIDRRDRKVVSRARELKKRLQEMASAEEAAADAAAS